MFTTSCVSRDPVDYIPYANDRPFTHVDFDAESRGGDVAVVGDERARSQ